MTCTVEDDCDPAPVVEVSVTSDEHPAFAPGAGGENQCPDAIVCNDSVELRAERRAVAGNGPVCVITVEATDFYGNVGVCQAEVHVPKGSFKKAKDSGQDYDPTVCDQEPGNGNGYGNGPDGDNANGPGDGEDPPGPGKGYKVGWGCSGGWSGARYRLSPPARR